MSDRNKILIEELTRYNKNTKYMCIKSTDFYIKYDNFCAKNRLKNLFIFYLFFTSIDQSAQMRSF